MELGKRIRLRREALGISQEMLAKKMGYKSRSSINKIELGLNDISQSKIIDFAKVLGTTPAYLMGWEDYPFQLKEMAENEIEKRKAMSLVEDSNIRLEKAMKQKNIEILELSQKTGISEKILSRYLSGDTSPGEDNIYLLGRTLEVSQYWLKGYDVPMEATYYSKTYELSAEEECIITIFRSLNKAAQDRLLDYSIELNEIPKYKAKNETADEQPKSKLG